LNDEERFKEEQWHKNTFAAYTSGDRVEYYSASRCAWLAGTIEVVAEGDSRNGCDGCPAMYTYHFIPGAKGRPRYNVPLSQLRLPLEEGEPVDVLSLDGSGAWLKAWIACDQPCGTTTHGYPVELEGSPEELEHIPAVRLRRRFPAGSGMDVYRGAALGWASARVHTQAGDAVPIADVQLWTMVPIVGIEADDTVETPEMVESYLLRTWPSSL